MFERRKMNSGGYSMKESFVSWEGDLLLQTMS